MIQTPIIDKELKTTKEPAGRRSPGATSNWRDRLENQRGSDTLTLVDLFIGDEGAYEAARFLKNNKDYISLQLRGNNISAAGFEAICQALKSSSRIETITAEWNNIGSDISGLVALHELLKYSNTVENIDLKNNRLGPNSARIIADIIRDTNSLKKLDLRWNELGEDGGRLVLEALQSSRRKMSIDLNGNKIPEEILSQINDPNANRQVNANRLAIDEKRDITYQQPLSSRNSNAFTSERFTSGQIEHTTPPIREDKYTSSTYNTQIDNLPSKYTADTQSYTNKYTSNPKLYDGITSGTSKYNYTASTQSNYGTGTTFSPHGEQEKNLTLATQSVLPTDAKISTYSHTYSPMQSRGTYNARQDLNIADNKPVDIGGSNINRYSPSQKMTYNGSRTDVSARTSYDYKTDFNKRFETKTLSSQPKDDFASTSKYQKYNVGAVTGLSQSIAPTSEFRHDVTHSTLKRSAMNAITSTETREKEGSYATEAENLKVGKLISDLERALEKERARANDAEGKLFVITRDYEMESNLRQEFERKYTQSSEDLRKAESELHNLRYELNKFTNENNGLKTEVSVLKQENTRLEEYNRTRITEIEERHRSQVKHLEASNQSLKEEFDSNQRQLNVQIVEIRKEFDSKSRNYEDQINEFAKLNDELSSELASQLEYIDKLKIEHEHTLKRSVDRAREEEINKANVVIRELETELRNVKSTNEQITRKSTEMLTDLQSYEKQIREQHIQFGNELTRLGAEIDKLRSELAQANTVIQKQNGEITSRDGVISKLEGEIERMRQEFQRVANQHVQQIESFKREYETERRRSEDNEKQILAKIEEYDRRLIESQNETIRITREYDRLVDAIQGNVSRVIHDTFVTHKNTSEIKNIEHRMSTLSTPSRAFGDERPGASSRILGSIEKKPF